MSQHSEPNLCYGYVVRNNVKRTGYTICGDSVEIKLVILVKKRRVENGMSLRKLEAVSGVSRNYISEVERGLSIPSILVLCKLGKAMGIPVTDLFWYK